MLHPATLPTTRTALQRAVELAYGRELREVLLEVLTRTGSVKQAAAEMARRTGARVGATTVYAWMGEEGLRIERSAVAVPVSDEAVPA